MVKELMDECAMVSKSLARCFLIKFDWKKGKAKDEFLNKNIQQIFNFDPFE